MDKKAVLAQIPAALHKVALAMAAVGIDWHVVLRNCLDLLAKQAGVPLPTMEPASFDAPATEANAVLTSASRMRQQAGDHYLAALDHERACQEMVDREEGEDDKTPG